MNELGPDARSILEAARPGEDPTDGDRARVRRALARSLAAGGAAAATTAAASSASAKGAGAAATLKLAALTSTVTWKALATVALVASVGAGISSFITQRDAPADPRSPAAASPPTERAPPRLSATEMGGVPSEPPSLPAPSPESPPPVVEAPAAQAKTAAAGARAPSKTSTTAAPVATEDALTVETRRLRDVHGALQSGDAGRALALLDEHAAAHAQGELRQERAAARVVALCELGRLDEAKVAMESFLREDPRSPLADRVRSACSPTAPR
jgi:hypothetical protein